MAAPGTDDEVLAKLEAIEAEMKTIGFWQEAPPKPKSPLDDAGFEAWLQTVFLPNARAAVRAGDLPNKSQVGVLAMRQYDYHGTVPEALRLVRLLHEFDDLINSR